MCADLLTLLLGDLSVQLLASAHLHRHLRSAIAFGRPHLPKLRALCPSTPAVKVMLLLLLLLLMSQLLLL